MPEKNDIYTLTADDITAEGMGVGRADGMAVFVSGMLPEETAEVRIIKQLKSYAVGKVESMLSTSPLRAVPVCPVFKECGGCTHMHLSYEGQLAAKTGHVKSCLKKFSGTDITPLPCIPSPSPLNYRNKISLPVEFDGGVKIGCYKKRSHHVVDTDECFIAPPVFSDIAALLRSFIREYKISVYNEVTHRGLLRHIVLRTSAAGDIMLGLVINGKALPHSDELVSLLNGRFPAVKTAVLNINTEKGNVILGRTTLPLFGSGRIRERILSREFDISLNTFLQVNHAQTENMYSYALSLLGEGSEVVCDLYCGAGTITLNAAPHARRIYGVEIVPQAIEDAKHNAELNGIENAEFICADCTRALPEIIKKDGRLDAVIVDPPRKGLVPSVITDIAKSGAHRVIYVSCDPATLARDIKLFIEQGYTLISAQPFDMFPQTGHVETVCLLSKKQSKV